MATVLNSPIVPANLAQRILWSQRVAFGFSVPLTDADGNSYGLSEIGDVRFGMADRNGGYGPQLDLGAGIGLRQDGSLVVADFSISAADMDIAIGEWRFLATFTVAGVEIPLCGGVLEVGRSPIRPR
jgi:hypothetical protein